MGSKHLVFDLPKLNANKRSYEECLRGKQSRLFFSKDMPDRSNVALEVLNSDICGPFEVSSLGGIESISLLLLMNI